jgi:NADPH:quinone reductase-like Zn-dependent oxidoreductase
MSDNKAAFLLEPKGRFEVRDAPIEQPGPGEVLVKVRSSPLAAGLRYDLHKLMT